MYVCMYTCIHVYIHVSTNKIQQVAGESPFEPCSKCLVSWHQINKGMFICRCLSFCLRAQGFCLRGYLVLRWVSAGLRSPEFRLTPHPYKGPFSKHERKGLERGSFVENRNCPRKITCPCDCRDPPSIKQKVHLFHSMGDGSIPILGDFHGLIWLVVDLPLWKNDGVRQLGWWHSQYMEKIKHVPNHQPVMDVFGMLESPLNISQYSLWL